MSLSGREDWKYALVRDGALSVVMDGLKLTVKLSVKTLDMILTQVGLCIYRISNSLSMVMGLYLL